ncbi:MAG TPA: peptide ABC transporter substrate-binding protein [Chloroflexota bacterium]|nr:peptide ABC transporter substrate-binding protein [Chloroflexota bacterium]
MRRVGIAVVFLLGAIMGCGSPLPTSSGIPSNASATVGQSKRIVAAIRGDPFTIADSINAAGGGRVAGVRDVELLVNSGLGLVDHDGALRPLIASTVPTLENGAWQLVPDGSMRTTWKLRPEAVWHDGAPVTSADLVFTTKVAMDKSLTIAQDTGYGYVESVEAPDAQTVTVVWKKPFIEADTLFSRTDRSRILPMPSHILEESYKDDPANFLQLPYWSQEFVGTGPFTMSSWVVGSHMVLHANDRFVLGRPHIDEIEVKFLWDTNVIVANVLSGAVDLTLGEGLSVEQAIMAREQWHEGHVEVPLETMTGLWPQFINPDPPVVADVRFRRALLHALDRQQIVDVFLGGLVPVADSFISPKAPDYSQIQPSVVQYPYDQRTAIDLIQSTGYTRGPEDFFVDPTGRKLSVELRTTAHELREKLLFVLADSWKAVGVGMDPIVIPRQRAADREYRATSLSFDFRFNPPEVTRYHSSQIPLPENGYRGNNSARYSSPELDALLERYVVTIPKSERVSLLAQIIHHMTDQLVVMPLFHDAEPVLIGNRLVNVGSKRGDSLQGWNAQDWDLAS